MSDDDLTSHLPWPCPVVPEYTAGSYGRWSLRPTPRMTYGTAGYFIPHREQPPGWVLRRGRDVWMSLTRMEVESHMPHIGAASGHVVVAGLGMGLMLNNVARLPQVTHVTVLEVDPDVVELFRRASGCASWPGWGKVEVVLADATRWRTSEPVDLFYADTWQKLGWVGALAAVQQMQPARQVSWWGQEWDFVEWCRRRRVAPMDACREDYRRFAEGTGLPMIEQGSLRYPALCWAAVSLQVAAKARGHEKDVLRSVTAQLLARGLGSPLDLLLGVRT